MFWQSEKLCLQSTGGSDLQPVPLLSHSCHAQYCRVVVLVKQRKFQSVIEEIFVIVDIEIFAVHIISGYSVQLIQDASLRLCDMKFSSKWFPASYIDRGHIKILPAIKNDQYRVRGKTV